MYRQRLKELAKRGLLVLSLFLCVAWGFFLNGFMERHRENQMEQKLESLCRQLDRKMEDARGMIEAVAGETAQMLFEGAGKDKLEEYFYRKTEEMTGQTDGECMSVYCANGEWQIMKDFYPDEYYNVQERLWYAGAIQAQGEVYVSSPYVDYRTGRKHYSVARQVEGPLAVCMDYSLSGLQKLLEENAGPESGIYMIVDQNGVFYAHSNPDYVGTSVQSVSGYMDIMQRVFAFPGQTLYQELNGTDFQVYSRKLESGWYAVVLSEDSIAALVRAQSTPQLLLLLLVWIFLALLFIVLFVRYRHDINTRRRQEFSENDLLEMSVRQRHYSLFIIIMIFIVSVIFILQGIASSFNSEREIMTYSVQNFRELVSGWYNNVQGILTFTDYYMHDMDESDIDYESVAGFLAKILDNSDDISNVYIYNPSWDYPVTDALGPGSMVSEGTRTAYSGAIALGGQNYVTLPYTDEKYRVYCVTFSKAIYDKNGNFLCVVCVDCYLDKLIDILGMTKTEEGYAFLVDKGTNIINHPYAAYQMRADRIRGVGGLSYEKAFINAGVVGIKDYDGVKRFCMVMTDEDTGFFIVVMREQRMLWRKLIQLMSMYFVVVFAGIGIVLVSMRSHLKWQNDVTQRLNDAAVLAEQSSRAKSDFLANMSHEIRTPMNAIVGMCEMILRETDISDTVREYGYNIQNSGRNLLSIINDILDFSKIEAGKIELIEEEFNLASTMNDVINMAVARKGNKRLEIIVHLDPEIPVGLVGDESRIRQIIINLVTNGIKYTNEGCVIITVSQTRQKYGINLSVSVKDTGIGISQENMDKLFHSFEQVDTKRNRSVEGTGLGLAISKRLITEMGGFINVSSVYGEGSEFKFVLPLAVCDRTPMIQVRNPEEIRAAGFFDRGKFKKEIIGASYEKLIGEIRSNLHVDIVLASELQEFKAMAAKGGYTHFYVGREEFLAEKEYYTELSAKSQIVVVQDRIDAVPLPSGIKCLYKPFSQMSVAAVFNNENIQTNLSQGKEYTESFAAPGATVLVVDDNPINLQVAEGLMRPYHMRVLTADSARAALELLKAKDIHLVFMDHMMPEIDGVEATKMIREMQGEYYAKLPIIALTANAVSGARNIFLSAGMNDFIAKPIEGSALERVLKIWLPEELIEKNYDGGESRQENVQVEEGTDFFSVKKGVSYTGGNLKNYYTILSSYVTRGEETQSQIQRFFEEEDWKNYVIQVHALKSTSLSIGSKELSDLAAELERAGKSGDYKTIRRKNESLLELYQRVREAGIKQLEADKEKNGAKEPALKHTKEIAREALEDYVQRIASAAEAFDADTVVALCGELFEYRYEGVELEEKFQKVKSAAEDFEYEQAGKEAESILTEFFS